ADAWLERHTLTWDRKVSTGNRSRLGTPITQSANGYPKSIKGTLEVQSGERRIVDRAGAERTINATVFTRQAGVREGDLITHGTRLYRVVEALPVDAIHSGVDHYELALTYHTTAG